MTRNERVRENAKKRPKVAPDNNNTSKMEDLHRFVLALQLTDMFPQRRAAPRLPCNDNESSQEAKTTVSPLR